MQPYGSAVAPWPTGRTLGAIQSTSDLRQRVLAAVFGWPGAADVRSSAGSGTEREFNVGKSLHTWVPYPAVTTQPSIPRKMASEPVLGRLERACVYEMCVQGSTGYRVITRRRIMYARTVFFRYRGLGKRYQWSIISQLSDTIKKSYQFITEERQWYQIVSLLRPICFQAQRHFPALCTSLVGL